MVNFLLMVGRTYLFATVGFGSLLVIFILRDWLRRFFGSSGAAG